MSDGQQARDEFDKIQARMEKEDPGAWEQVKEEAAKLGIDEEELRFILKMRHVIRSIGKGK